jgi:hypothetical protein
MSYAQRRRFLWILFLAGLVLLAVVASATTLERMHFEELAKQATAVARLRCLGAESRWENGEIWTETRFEVVEQNKGQLPNVVKVRMLGGSVGALHSRIDGVPTFHSGEEAYVFLWKHEGEPFRILGWSQGTFRIAKDALTGLGNRDAGFRGRADLRPPNAPIPARRHSQTAGNDFSVEAAKSAARRNAMTDRD